LLARFRHPGDPAEIGSYWSDVLPEPLDATLDLFRRNDWLIDAPWQQVFAVRNRLDELKTLLRERGLRVSGKKAELVDRLIEADEEGMRGRVANVKAWVLSPSVTAAVEQYEAQERAAEGRAKEAAWAALHDGRIRAAVDAIVGYERSRLFPRGMGVNWHGEAIAQHMTERAEAILQATPGILREVPSHELEALRPVAAMLELTGESRAKAWLPTGLGGHPRMDLETVVRMLLFHGSNTATLRRLRSGGFEQVDIMACGSSCPTCQALGGKAFPVMEVPELPHPDCTHEMGCRCLYQAHLTY
jgi:hypothetical protein